jgi:hypothetical protein
LQVERDERNYTRANQLFENGLLSKEEYENSLSTYQISTNNLVRAEKHWLRLMNDSAKLKFWHLLTARF